MYNAGRVIAPFTAPDAQYAITRERIKLLEAEYNCTIIYLGTEVLLSDELGDQTSKGALEEKKKKELEKAFYKCYDTVRKDPKYFLEVNKDDKKYLYAYISQYISTWFSSKGSNGGKYLDDEGTGTSKIMFLAGRGVVQLKRKEIIDKIK